MSTNVSTTLSNILTYDLQDADENNWTQTELLEYLNRFHRLLHRELVLEDSDFVRSEATVALSAGDGSKTLASIATDIWTINQVWVDGESELASQVDWSYIRMYNTRYGSANGVPRVFCLHDSSIYFRPTSSGGNVYIQYTTKPTVLTTASTFPYNDMFLDAARQFTVLMAQNRDEYTVDMESNIYRATIEAAGDIHRRRQTVLKRAPSYDWVYRDKV